jgi:two-component system CheB/CheR fusion protein
MGGLREAAVDAVPAAMVVIDNDGVLAMVNAVAIRLLGLSSKDVGRPFQDLEIYSRPVDLGSGLKQVRAEGMPLVQEQVPWPTSSGALAWLDIHFVPVVDPGGAKHGIALTFMDVSLARRQHDELLQANRGLETAYRELQVTIEDLATTTEELQSSNTGLESMKAELQFSSDELESLGDELRTCTAELLAADDLLESMLIGRRNGLVVIDRGLRVSVWRDRSAELWGLRSQDASNRHFLNLDVGLPVEELRDPIMAVLAGHSDRETADVDAVSRRGREFTCRVSMFPLVGRDRQIRGAIILTEDVSSVEGAAGPEAKAAERPGQHP